eukprot:4751853-Pyramimonas_sp.AAC.1
MEKQQGARGPVIDPHSRTSLEHPRRSMHIGRPKRLQILRSRQRDRPQLIPNPRQSLSFLSSGSPITSPILLTIGHEVLGGLQGFRGGGEVLKILALVVV